MTLLDYYTFIKGSNCGLNVRWPQILVPIVKIGGHLGVEEVNEGLGLGFLILAPFPFHSFLMWMRCS